MFSCTKLSIRGIIIIKVNVLLLVFFGSITYIFGVSIFVRIFKEFRNKLWIYN